MTYFINVALPESRPQMINLDDVQAIKDCQSSVRLFLREGGTTELSDISGEDIIAKMPADGNALFRFSAHDGSTWHVRPQAVISFSVDKPRAGQDRQRARLLIEGLPDFIHSAGDSLTKQERDHILDILSCNKNLWRADDSQIGADPSCKGDYTIFNPGKIQSVIADDGDVLVRFARDQLIFPFFNHEKNAGKIGSDFARAVAARNMNLVEFEGSKNACFENPENIKRAILHSSRIRVFTKNALWPSYDIDFPTPEEAQRSLEKFSQTANRSLPPHGPQ